MLNWKLSLEDKSVDAKIHWNLNRPCLDSKVDKLLDPTPSCTVCSWWLHLYAVAFSWWRHTVFLRYSFLCVSFNTIWTLLNISQYSSLSVVRLTFFVHSLIIVIRLRIIQTIKKSSLLKKLFLEIIMDYEETLFQREKIQIVFLCFLIPSLS